MVERAVVKALSKLQVDRTATEHRMLMEFFASASCFREIDIKLQDLSKVVQKMEYKRMQANETIFSIGD
jgi:hypothetical protein